MVSVHHPPHGGPPQPAKKKERRPPLELGDTYDRQTWTEAMNEYQLLCQEEQGALTDERRTEIAKEKARIKAYLRLHAGTHDQYNKTGYEG